MISRDRLREVAQLAALLPAVLFAHTRGGSPIRNLKLRRNGRFKRPVATRCCFVQKKISTPF
jgi:hypothetical protein